MDKIILSIAASTWLLGHLIMGMTVSLAKINDAEPDNYEDITAKYLLMVIVLFGLILFL